MDQKQGYKEKYEKGKLHARYLFIIAGILAVIGISIALGGNSEALGQISMASTVSSIILSSIAIFMSISGENKLNYTQNTLMETSNRLSYITDNIEKNNSIFDDTISQKLLKLDEISDRLVKIGQSVDNVEKEVFNKSFNINKSNTVDFSNDILWNIYTDTLIDLDDSVVKMVRSIVEYYIVCQSVTSSGIDPDKMAKYFNSKMENEHLGKKGIACGIVYVFIEIGIMKADTLIYFEKKMNIPEESRNEIIKFL